jgi:hypothetical protein
MQLSAAFPQIASKIFGNEAFIDPEDPDCVTIVPEVQEFINGVMPFQYRRLRRAFIRERTRRNKCKEAMETCYAGEFAIYYARFNS